MNRIIGVILCFVFASADAALISRLGGQAYYDDVLNITWAADADMNGLDTWDNQVAWAAGLTIVGVTGWRLPNMDVNGDDIVVACYAVVGEVACRDNELGYMFHENGVTSEMPGLFENIQPYVYWSGTEYIGDSNQAWDAGFFGSGLHGHGGKSNNFHAWAVRDGDVANVVPVPAAAWLFCSALAGLAGLRRARRRLGLGIQ